LPEFSIPAQKVDIDNNASFRYQLGYWFRLIDASISGVLSEADRQFSIFNSSASEKQLLIFFSIHPLRKSNFLSFFGVATFTVVGAQRAMEVGTARAWHR